MTPLFRPAAVEHRRHQWLGSIFGLKLPGLGGAARRTPVQMQGESAECGLACLAMVAAAHGLNTDLVSLRSRFPGGLKGSTLVDLVRVSESLGLQARPLRAEPDELGEVQLPCVLHWNLNHFVVLVSIQGGIATIHDPARGRRRMRAQGLSRHFTGVVLELLPAAGFEPRDERSRVTVRQMLGRVTGVGPAAARILLLALALEFLALLSPFFMQYVVDDVLARGDRNLLTALGLGFAMLVLVQTGTAAARSWAVLRLSASVSRQWLGNVFAHLVRLPLAWFEKRHAGDVMSRFMSVQQIQRTLSTSFVEAVLDGLMVTLTFAMMLSYSLPLTALALAAAALYALLRRVYFRPLREAAEETLVHEARQSSHFLESLRGMQAIKLFNAQALRQARFSSLVVETLNADIASRRLQMQSAVLHRLLFGLERVAVIWFGALLVLDKHLSVGMLFAFFAFREQFSLRISALIDKVVELKMLRLQGERLADIVLSDREPDAQGTSPRPLPGAPAIELRGVSFRYGEGEADVLNDLSLRIDHGESVAIVGPSGCGKSTLMKLLLGANVPQSGEVLVGGVPLPHLGVAAWRDQVGAVMQDEPLFAGTVADNISFFDPQVDAAWVEECARIAALHDEISAMPMGYQTLVGESANGLSGGQKQRILLARALYKRPSVLMLDEATSALDVDGERVVNQAVRALSLTRVIVAHRPETIASAGRVIALRGGRVAQDLRALRAGAPMH